MSKIKLTGESSGYVEISAGNAAGNNTLEAPTSGTRLVAHEGSQDVTLNGNLTVNGVISYEDTTNIDSVGVITARAGVNVTGGSLTVDAFSNTANNYLSLRNGYVPSASGGMGFMSADHSGSNADGVAIYGHDGISLYTAQAERLRIDSTGNIGIGTETIQANINYNTLEIVGDAGTTGGGIVRLKTGNLAAKTMLFCDMGGFEARVETNHPFVISTNNTERLRITSDGKVRVPDNGKFTAGAGDDLQIYHDGSVNRIRSDVLTIIEKNDSEDMASFMPDGAVVLFHNGSQKFETTSSGVAIHEDTDKVVRFTGAIGEIGNVTGFQGSNTAGNALTDLGMRGTTLRFATGSAERLRINSAGEVYIGSTTANGQGKLFVNDSSGATTTRVHIRNAVSTGNAETYYNLDGTKFASVGLENGSLVFRNSTSSTPTERLRITSDGRMGLGNISPGDYDAEADNFVVASSDHTGITIASTGSSKRTNLYFADGTSGNARYRGAFTYDHNSDFLQVRTSGQERLRIDSDGNVNIGNKDHHSHNGTVDSLQIGHALNLYEDSYTSGTDNYAIWANNAYYRSGGGNYYMRNDEASRILQYAGEMWFQNAAAGTAENAISFDTKLRITSGGNFHLSTGQLKTSAGDKFAEIRGGGVINTKRLATGHFGNTAAYQPQQLGYIGDYMHYGCNAVYYLAQTSTGNSGYSSHMFSWYDSGHWGHYGKFVLMCHEASYIGGMCHRYLSGTNVTTIFSIGQASSVSTTSTTTGSGTHSGQSVTRYDCTVSHSGTYRTCRWYLGLLHGAQLGVTGNGKSQSDCNTYANSNGSLLHLFGVSDSNLTMAPNYRTW